MVLSNNYYVVSNGKLLFNGTETDCGYFASGLDRSYAIFNEEEYREAMAIYGNKTTISSRKLMRNISNNTISGASDRYMKRRGLRR